MPSQSLSLSPDEPIIARCLAGEAEAFSVLVDRYRGPIYSFAYRMIGDAEEANDLAQETFVRAYRALKRFSTDRKFLPWLFTIAANLCKSWLRRAPHQPLPLEEIADCPEAAEGSSPEHEAASRLYRQQVRQAIHSLPTRYRVIIILRHLRDMSYEEISETLQLPVSTVEHRLRTAREMLREALEEEVS